MMNAQVAGRVHVWLNLWLVCALGKGEDVGVGVGR